MYKYKRVTASKRNNSKIKASYNDFQGDIGEVLSSFNEFNDIYTNDLGGNIDIIGRYEDANTGYEFQSCIFSYPKEYNDADLEECMVYFVEQSRSHGEYTLCEDETYAIIRDDREYDKEYFVEEEIEHMADDEGWSPERLAEEKERIEDLCVDSINDIYNDWKESYNALVKDAQEWCAKHNVFDNRGRSVTSY